jgi:predicted small secreted protein
LPAPALPANLAKTTSKPKGYPMTRIALIIAILGLAACETVQGVGRDITNAGAAIDRSL